MADEIKKLSDYLTLQLGMTRACSSENGANAGSQTDKMFWSGAVGTCDCLKGLVSEQNLMGALAGKGVDVAAEIFKMAKPIKKTGQVKVKPHCPQCLTTNLDEMGVTADGVRSYACKPCRVLLHILPLGEDF